MSKNENLHKKMKGKIQRRLSVTFDGVNKVDKIQSASDSNNTKLLYNFYG